LWVLRLDVAHRIVDDFAHIRAFGQTQQVVEPRLRGQIEDALGLVRRGIVHAGAAPPAASVLVQHGPSGEETHLGEPQEDEAEDRLRILRRGQA
jgi:hypothetical protein